MKTSSFNPDLEVVGLTQNESFKAWSHGYPFRTVRWHFHPEYELQLITHTSGQYFVGDFVGDFVPGNLVFMAPNLPHNWVSDVPEGAQIEERGQIIQFSSDFLVDRILAFPECAHMKTLAEEARQGVLFSEAVSNECKALMVEILSARNSQRIVLFFSLFEKLLQDEQRVCLASHGYAIDPSRYMSSAINQVLTYMDEKLAEDLNEAAIAEMIGQSTTCFSRYFRRHVGITFVQYINNLRIKRACELLVASQASVSDICFSVGYNNVSNFNRHFLTQKGVPPSRFRALHQINQKSPALSA